MADPAIGRMFGISFNTLSAIMVRERGTGAFGPAAGRKIRQLEPENFKPETSTVWSFRSRGNWATHSGAYRGNWSPYIPRNIIWRYSGQGGTVLDCFVGGGTTAVEALLLNRKFIGIDINPLAIEITLKNLEALREYASLEGRAFNDGDFRLKAGDAGRLHGIPGGSVELICAHPPYAEIVRYSSGLSGDLSALPVADYLKGMRSVIAENMRVLKDEGRCALLIGDKRKDKRVVPLGFMLIEEYLRSGFELQELILKRQFNTRTTGLWYRSALKGRFLLLAHEYLPVFVKGERQIGMMDSTIEPRQFTFSLSPAKLKRGADTVETTTVWDGSKSGGVLQNLERLSGGSGVLFLRKGRDGKMGSVEGAVYVDMLLKARSAEELLEGRCMLRHAALRLAEKMKPGALVGIGARDLKVGEALHPSGLLVWHDMKQISGLRLKEVIIVDETGKVKPVPAGEPGLRISHSYLLVYERE